MTVQVPNKEIVINPYEDRSYQTVGTNFLKLVGRGILRDDPGLGKAQPLDAMVLTNLGFRTIGSLEVGDGIIGIDGLCYEVRGIFPQGTKEVYKITTNDNYSTEACDEHLWTLAKERKSGGIYKKEFRTISTLELKDELENSLIRSSRLTQLPDINCVEDFISLPLEIDPYIMGCILGDGNIDYHGVSISSSDTEIIDNIVERLDEEYELVYKGKYDYRVRNKSKIYARNEFTGLFAKYGLIGKLSHEKFIPFNYLYSDSSQRLELLRGLMDTDGYVLKDGTIQFTTVSEQLANDVRILIWSLAGLVRTTTKIPTYTYNGEKKKGRLAYTLTLCLPNELNPFRLTRKRELVKERTKYFGIRYIKSVEFIGVKECVCIKTSAPDSLYITDNFIPTHNTPQAIKAAELPCMVLAPRYLVGQWEEAILREHPSAKIALASGSRKQRDAMLERDTDWYIANYEMVKSYDMPTNIRTFINDEGHHLRNRGAKKTKAVFVYENLNPDSRIYHLTATPFWKNVDDIWMQLHILYPQIFTSYHNFVKAYCNVRRTHYGMAVKGFRASKKQEIFNLLSPIMLGRTYADVGRFLPEAIESAIRLKLPPALKLIYEKLVSTYSLDWATDEDAKKKLIFQPTTVLHALRQVTFNAGKIDAVLGILEDNNDKPAVIGTWYVDHAEQMHAAVVEKYGKDSAVLITGKLGGEERQRVAIQAQKQKKFIVASQQSLQEGVNLYEYRLFIRAEKNYVPGSNDQFVKRVVRDRNDNGADKEPVRVFDVLVSGSIDVTIDRISRTRSSSIEATRKLLQATLGDK